MQNNQLKRKFFLILGSLLCLLLTLFLAKNLILRQFGAYLIVENEFSFVENAFVLSGSALDRGAKAAVLFNEKKIAHVWCTGANLSPDLRAIGIDTLESEVSKSKLLSEGIPDSAITLLPQGTSTMEESKCILDLCVQNDITEIVIISSSFHTRRIKQVFTQTFKDRNIVFYIQGAASSQYNEEDWWTKEEGLIALNNEYIKLIYYWWKY